MFNFIKFTLVLAIITTLTLISCNAQEDKSMKSSLYDFTVKDIDGKDVKLSDFKGKVILIVNVASQCGFTKQYTGLQEIYQKYKDKGFVVLGFPCNQFGGQEPGSEEDIKTFCSSNYNVTFPMFSKIDVNGDNTAPLYEFLKNEVKGIVGTKDIKWNFTKFLIDKNGKVVDRFAPQTAPADIADDIEKLL